MAQVSCPYRIIVTLAMSDRTSSRVECIAFVDVYNPKDCAYVCVSEDARLCLTPETSCPVSQRPRVRIQVRGSCSGLLVHNSVVQLARPGSGLRLYWLVEDIRDGPRTFRARLLDGHDYKLLTEFIDNNIVLGNDLETVKEGLLCSVFPVKEIRATSDAQTTEPRAGVVPVVRGAKGRRALSFSQQDLVEEPKIDIAGSSELSEYGILKSQRGQACLCKCPKCQLCLGKLTKSDGPWDICDVFYYGFYTGYVFIKVFHHMLMWSIDLPQATDINPGNETEQTQMLFD